MSNNYWEDEDDDLDTDTDTQMDGSDLLKNMRSPPHWAVLYRTAHSTSPLGAIQ